MILVYPMLTSESVNPTILPGLIKAIEKYILIYNTDDILKHVNSNLSHIVQNAAKGIVTVGAGLAVAALAKKVGDEAGEYLPTFRMKGKKFELTEQPKTYLKVQPQKTTTTGQDVEKGTKAAGKSAIKDLTKTSTITGFEMPKYDTVSLEPTWVQVTTGLGAKLIGVKVVPFKVKSTTGMVGLLMQDKELKKMDYLAQKMGRTVMRVVFRALRGLKIPGFKDKAISGNAQADIVWATSQYGKNAFVCFSQLDLEKDDIFTSPQAVQKLHKLGWASLIVTDDVNKQATFCMKQFGGICSTIPYSFIFASLGKEHAQVYKDIEDAARSAGPFFRKSSTTRKKLFSDSITLAKLEKYSTLRE